MTVDRWKLTSYCSCNPSTTRGHFEKSSDELAVWVLLSDHEAEIAARDQALKDLGYQLGEAEQELARTREELERVKSQAHIKIEQLRVDYERLRKAIEDHQTAVCDNPQAAGIFADELLWAVLEPVPQDGQHGKV